MAERLAILDFDLTLFKSYDFKEILLGYYAAQGVDLSTLVVEEGTSPDVFGMIEAQAGHSLEFDIDAIERFAKQQHGKNARDFIQSDAFGLIEALEDDHETDVAVLTRGAESNQRLKLAFAARAIGEFDSTIVPVGGAPKGELIAGWHQDDGYHYRLEGEERTVPNVVLFDDKISDFVGLPADESAVGVWIQRRAVTERDRLLHRDLNRSGQHIFAMSSLYHAIQLLKAA